MRGGKHWSLATYVNKQIQNEADLPSQEGPNTRPRGQKWPNSKNIDPLASLASRAAGKLEEGNYKGAVKLACIADHSPATLEA